MENSDRMDNAFIKWMLSVTAAVVVAITGAIFTTIMSLKEDVAGIKEQVVSVKSNVEAVRELQTLVQEHEIRIRWIENGAINNTSPDAVHDTWKGLDSNKIITHSP